MTLPLKSDASLNQEWLQKIASAPDGMHLLVAAHDGKQLAIAQYDQGANVQTHLTLLPAKGSPSAAAVSDSGSLIAVGTEARGADAPAQAWLINQAGAVVWTRQFPKTIVGLHFVSDGSLVIATAGAEALKVSAAGTEVWRTP